MRCHPVGTCAQALGLGLYPRLSIGTLQLSIRCSSIHFLPRRSFPVSVPCWIADFGEGRSSAGAFCATVENVGPDNTKQSVKIETHERLCATRMDASQIAEAWVRLG